MQPNGPGTTALVPCDHLSYEPGVLRLLDQTALPQRTQYLELHGWPEVINAITGMKVRGAPAIGITAAYGMALAAHAAFENGLRGDEFFAELEFAAGALAQARPTAVNLSWAIERLRGEVRTLRERRAPEHEIPAALTLIARSIHEDDIAACLRIGDVGAALIPSGSQVLTHCNTGTLATGGYGTALGIVRSAWRDGRLKHVFVAETRPLLQGGRLTAWELQRDGIPFTLISDSMAAHFMQRKQVGAVVVGADRIASNGDVANKIGTYALAVLARAHDVPFIVAAPLSTFDPAIGDGMMIPIEERSPDEVTQIGGVRLAPDGSNSANPAFDVTPAAFISAIVTEAGIARAPLGESIAALLGATQRLLATPG